MATLAMGDFASDPPHTETMTVTPARGWNDTGTMTGGGFDFERWERREKINRKGIPYPATRRNRRPRR